jgi:hypothetical protein
MILTRDPLLSPETTYVLGASFGVASLERRYREYVVQNFEQFLKLDNCFSMLTRWCPEKLAPLVSDAMAIQRERIQHSDTELALAKGKWDTNRNQMDELISCCTWV